MKVPIHISDSITGQQPQFNTDTVKLNLQKSISTIKPILDFPLTGWEITGLILIILIVSALIFFLARKFIFVKPLKSSALIFKNFRKEATQKLDELNAKYLENLITQDQYYFEVSLAIRHFISGKFKIDAPYLTSEQLVLVFSKFNISSGMIDSVYTFLQEADKVKFSAFRPDPFEVRQFSAMAYQTLDDLDNLKMIKI